MMLTLKNCGLTVLGTLILAFSFEIFYAPFDLVAGGASGVAIVISKLVPESITYIFNLEVIVAIVTWGLFFLGLFTLGRSFAAKTLLSTVVYTTTIPFIDLLKSPDILGGYFYLEGAMHNELAMLIAAVVGGALIGVGCAITFLGGASTGGTDILAFIICKYFKKSKLSKVTFVVDGSVVLLGAFVVQDMIVTMLGVVAALVGAILIDKVFLGGTKSFIAQIISEKHEDIKVQVLEKLERGATVMDVVGAYSGENRKLLMVSFTMSQYSELLNIINKTDRMAFVTIHKAYEINGEGWTR